METQDADDDCKLDLSVSAYLDEVDRLESLAVTKRDGSILKVLVDLDCDDDLRRIIKTHDLHVSLDEYKQLLQQNGRPNGYMSFLEDDQKPNISKLIQHSRPTWEQEMSVAQTISNLIKYAENFLDYDNHVHKETVGVVERLSEELGKLGSGVLPQSKIGDLEKTVKKLEDRLAYDLADKFDSMYRKLSSIGPGCQCAMTKQLLEAFKSTSDDLRQKGFPIRDGKLNVDKLKMYDSIYQAMKDYVGCSE